MKLYAVVNPKGDIEKVCLSPMSAFLRIKMQDQDGNGWRIVEGRFVPNKKISPGLAHTGKRNPTSRPG